MAKIKVSENNVSEPKPQKENENELVYLSWQMRKTWLKVSLMYKLTELNTA